MSTIVDANAALGERIRGERARRGWSLSELAGASGVSRAMISRIERGESSPTAAVLGKLSAALELSVSTLLSGGEPAAGTNAASVVRRAAQVPTWTDPDTGFLRRQISTPRSPADVTEIVLPPGAVVPFPAAAYAFIAQIVWVLEGELTLVDGDERHVLGAGDTFHLGAPLRREFRNESGAACRYVVVVTSAW